MEEVGGAGLTGSLVGTGGGGGWPSEFAHACCAAFSSTVANGSNSRNTSCVTGGLSTLSGAEEAARPCDASASSSDRSGAQCSLVTSVVGGVSCHGLDSGPGVGELSMWTFLRALLRPSSVAISLESGRAPCRGSSTRSVSLKEDEIGLISGGGYDPQRVRDVRRASAVKPPDLVAEN